ncbi:MAG: hypothetical protein AB1640_16545 [bacterium]
MIFKRRVVIAGRIVRIYERGGILLSKSGESLEEISDGMLREGSPEAEAVSGCLLCDRPSSHWGLFMTGEEAASFGGAHACESAGTFFGLCGKHDPHENEDEVCDAAYWVMASYVAVEGGIRLAEEAVNTWFELLIREGLNKEQALRHVLSRVEQGELLDGFEMPEDVKAAVSMALQDELKRESL